MALLAALPIVLVGLAYSVMGSSYVTDQSITREQPVPFSHAHHVGGLGLDCRYCHEFGGESSVRRNPPDGNLHDVSFADLDQRIDAGAGTR